MGRSKRQAVRSLVAALTLAAVFELLLLACSSDGAVAPPESSAPPGSSSPVDEPESTDPSSDAEPPDIVFASPVNGLSDEELDMFSRGNRFFHQTWSPAGEGREESDGLGPLFNSTSCASCHQSTGVRASPPQGAFDGAGLLVRISVPGADASTGAPLPHRRYGDQLQDRATEGVEPEGVAWNDYVVQQGSYGDGTPFEILWPTVTVRDRRYGTLEPDVQLSARNGAQLIGLGLLEAVPVETITALADPTDSDGDAVSGRVNIVWDPTTSDQALGRFGWKANVATLEHQIALALHGDIGITSPLAPDDNCAAEQPDCRVLAGDSESEVGPEQLDALLLYMRTLDVPGPRTDADPEAVAGRDLFEEFACATCHVPELRTGPSPVAALSDRDFAPYTDLLLHDMGFDMGDGRPDFQANGNEWRTPPLWGLGLVPSVDGSLGLLHDGRARTIEEAILWHGGEGSPSRAAFLRADEVDRVRLIRFLESL